MPGQGPAPTSEPPEPLQHLLLPGWPASGLPGGGEMVEVSPAGPAQPGQAPRKCSCHAFGLLEGGCSLGRMSWNCLRSLTQLSPQAPGKLWSGFAFPFLSTLWRREGPLVSEQGQCEVVFERICWDFYHLSSSVHSSWVTESSWWPPQAMPRASAAVSPYTCSFFSTTSHAHDVSPSIPTPHPAP